MDNIDRQIEELKDSVERSVIVKCLDLIMAKFNTVPLTPVLDQKKFFFAIHQQPYTFLETSGCGDSKNHSDKIRIVPSLM